LTGDKTNKVDDKTAPKVWLKDHLEKTFKKAGQDWIEKSVVEAEKKFKETQTFLEGEKDKLKKKTPKPKDDDIKKDAEAIEKKYKEYTLDVNKLKKDIKDQQKDLMRLPPKTTAAAKKQKQDNLADLKVKLKVAMKNAAKERRKIALLSEAYCETAIQEVKDNLKILEKFEKAGKAITLPPVA